MRERKHYFDSPAALYAAATTDATGLKNKYSAIISRNSTSFIGASFEEIEARRWGWAEGLRMLETLPEWKVPPAAGGRWVKSWSDYDGDELDHERFYAGAPCLARRVKTTGHRIKGVNRVIVNIGENCRVLASDMLWKSYAATRLVDCMESNGERCEIYAAAYGVECFKDKFPDRFMMTKLKAAEEPLNVALCLSVFSPWMFRFWYFLIIEQHREAYAHKGYSRKISERPDAAGAIIIDTGDCLSKDAAARFIEQHTNKPTGARS